MSARTERDWVTWTGLGVVGIAAAIMSFTALSDLAELCGITSRIPLSRDVFEGAAIHVAWLLPLTVDVLAGVATRVWLRRRTNAEALAFAQRSAWSAIVATVVGNAAHGALVWSETRAPWWAAVLVSAVPALALGAMVHLAVLVGRGPDQPAVEPVVRDPWTELLDEVLAEAWDHPVRAWSAAVDAADRQIPSRDEPDDVLAADLQAEVSRIGRPLSRDEVLARYRIGATRADRLRKLADPSTAPTAA